MGDILVKVDRNGTQHYVSHRCRKCAGQGYILGYEHIDGARCWDCGATGVDTKGWKYTIMTPEYTEKLRLQRLAKAQAKAPEQNAKMLERDGFNPEGKTYVVTGKTYSIKDELKTAGAKFNERFGWHFATKPEQFPTVEISIEEVATKDEIGLWQYNSLTETDAIVDAKIAQQAPKPSTKWIGREGERITEQVVLQKVFQFETHFTYYGETHYIYKFITADGDILVWKTGPQVLDEGKAYTLTGTVKHHDDYKGEKQTVLTRCKVCE